jgi:hypothetical protein
MAFVSLEGAGAARARAVKTDKKSVEIVRVRVVIAETVRNI